jgi:hypothetical protein
MSSSRILSARDFANNIIVTRIPKPVTALVAVAACCSIQPKNGLSYVVF